MCIQGTVAEMVRFTPLTTRFWSWIMPAWLPHEGIISVAPQDHGGGACDEDHTNLGEYRCLFPFVFADNANTSFLPRLMQARMVSQALMPVFPPSLDISHLSAGAGLQVGIDLVQISRIQHSMDHFGDRFIERVFTEHESAYAGAAPALQSERLAARFAAKEAALKALGLAGKGVGWRDMEVFRHPDGQCQLRLHARAADMAARRGLVQVALSLSHDGAYAAAIVAAVFAPTPDLAVAGVRKAQSDLMMPIA